MAHADLKEEPRQEGGGRDHLPRQKDDQGDSALEVAALTWPGRGRHKLGGRKKAGPDGVGGGVPVSLLQGKHVPRVEQAKENLVCVEQPTDIPRANAWN